MMDSQESTPEQEAISRVALVSALEALRAKHKYPSDDGMFVALLCACGELATALRNGDKEHIADEAKQVAAVAFRLSVYGDNDAAIAFCPLREIGDLQRENADLRYDLERTRNERNRVGITIRNEWMQKCEQVEREKKVLKQLLHDARSEIIDLRIQVALKPAQLTEDEAKGTVQTAWVDPKQEPKQEPKMITHSAIVQLQKQLKQEEE